MRTLVPLFLGIFCVMALSNAVVPVLPSYSTSSPLQGAIFSAYFLGAFISTLPAGLLSDRFGRVPLIRAGLVITAVSGLLLSLLTAPYPVLAVRWAEGIGAGCFVAAAMSYVNSRADHERMSGYFLALLNAGLVLGLILAGWLASHSAHPQAGILPFAVLALVPAAASFLIRDSGDQAAPFSSTMFVTCIRDFRWLWVSSVVLIGITGVVSSLYPQFSGASSENLGYWIAGMSVATIGAVLAVSRVEFPPIPVIRWSAVLMAPGVLISFFSPWGFVVLGALAGVVMVAQMEVLAGVRDHQGVVMGLFSTMGYLGMAILPFCAGIVAGWAGFFASFCITAFLALMVAVTAGHGPVHYKAR